MARITTEDCLKNKGIKSHFELVLFAAFRARSIESGEAPKLDLYKNRSSAENVGAAPGFKHHSNVTAESHIFLDEKSAVLALREIAKGVLDLDSIKKQIVNEVLKGSFIENSKFLSENESQDSLIDEFSQTDITADDAFYIAHSEAEESEDDSVEDDLVEFSEE
jgi:DNA-directed RNA polymerase omega subunit